MLLKNSFIKTMIVVLPLLLLLMMMIVMKRPKIRTLTGLPFN